MNLVKSLIIALHLLCSVLFSAVWCVDLAEKLKPESLEQAWKDYQAKFNKTYLNQTELSMRLDIFKKSYKRIVEHNDRYDKGQVTYQLAINKFADMTTDEFRSKYLKLKFGRKRSVEAISEKRVLGAIRLLPKAIDWRAKLVNPVRDQGECGSCWAFSAVATLESAYAKRYNRKISFSEQHLLDCTWKKPYENNGCDGGFEYNALQYAKENGIVMATSTPYRSKSIRNDKCPSDKRFKPTMVKKIIPAFSNSNDESALKAAVAQYGVVSVAIDADDLLNYMRGIYNGPCLNREEDLNHAVNIVGYDESTSKPFWIVRNSWGSDWGEDGYFRLAMNKNACGVNQDRSYAVF